MSRTLIKTIVDSQIINGPPCVTTSANVTSSSFVTVSNSPTLTFTPTVSGKYKVYSSPWTYDGSAGGYGVSRIFNTAGGASLIKESWGTVYGNSGDHGSSTYIESTYNLVAGVSYSFDIQMLTSTGVGLIGSAPYTQFNICAEKIGS